MQFHTLKPKTKRKSAKYIGRGGKRGTTSGRGTKGQKARAGHKIRPEIRDIIKKIPKLRGYRFKSFAPETFAFNLDFIRNHFSAGNTVSPAILYKKNFLPKSAKSGCKIKILGDGRLDIKLKFENCDVSGSARVKILEAGGTIGKLG